MNTLGARLGAPVELMASGALVQTYVPEHIPANKSAVVLLGGIATGLPHLEPVCRELSQLGHTAYAYFPYIAALLPPPLTIEATATMLVKISTEDISNFAKGPVTLVGDSFGGIIARAIAQHDRQALIAALVLANTGALEPNSEDLVRLAENSTSPQSLYGGAGSRYTPNVITLDTLTKTFPYTSFFPLQAGLAQYWLRHPPRSLQHTAVIRDSDDVFVTAESTTALLQLLQKSNVTTSSYYTNKLGHLSLTTGPKEIAEIVSKFVSENRPRSAAA